ncbi:unnamed protein product [Mucor hiemalis]
MERTKIVLLVASEPRIRHFVVKVTHRALISLRFELNKTVTDATALCSCLSQIRYGISRCHDLQKMGEISLDNIPLRWKFDANSSQPAIGQSNDNSTLYSNSQLTEDGKVNTISLSEESWVQYVFEIEQAFRSNQDNQQKLNFLTRGLKHLLVDVENNEDPFIGSAHHCKSPGRPKKPTRLPSVKKDFVNNSTFRKNKLVYGKTVASQMSRASNESSQVNEKQTVDDIIHDVNNTLIDDSGLFDDIPLFDYFANENANTIPNEANSSREDVTPESLPINKKRRTDVENASVQNVSVEDPKDYYWRIHLSIGRDCIKTICNPKVCHQLRNNLIEHKWSRSGDVHLHSSK